MAFQEDDPIRHCDRCDEESRRLITFLSPDNVTELLCWRCVRQEDQRDGSRRSRCVSETRKKK